MFHGGRKIHYRHHEIVDDLSNECSVCCEICKKKEKQLNFLIIAMKQNSQPSKILTLSHEVQKRDFPPYELHRKNFHSTLPRCYRKKNVKEFFHCAEMMLIGPDE